ncbi:hypothetical protein J2786_002076 [Chryseobacterium vietnamense]|uniref:Uncharacterized protein n=1 Tax=Chryseobacterium vietnamense TaxID=866785 RepID=A0ACC6J7Z8_9FLAO|nr:hypothetical protein [Chryseobacterium vietnamense]MDR6458969.1 hypothetical protein [Chryseobacterium vietnamense]
MKKLIFSVCILLGQLCFSQTATKKFNSFQNRYEYFDSNGNMTGYEKYNSFSKQWEYYTTNNTSQSRQPTQYREPAKLDISALGNAMTTKQNNYNYNVQQLQNAVNTISDQINNLDLSYEQRKLIYDTFQQNCVNEINRTRINYSLANETNRVIQWLYDSLNTIIKNTTSTSNYNSKEYPTSDVSKQQLSAQILERYSSQIIDLDLKIMHYGSNNNEYQTYRKQFSLLAQNGELNETNSKELFDKMLNIVVRLSKK